MMWHLVSAFLYHFLSTNLFRNILNVPIRSTSSFCRPFGPGSACPMLVVLDQSDRTSLNGKCSDAHLQKHIPCLESKPPRSVQFQKHSTTITLQYLELPRLNIFMQNIWRTSSRKSHKRLALASTEVQAHCKSAIPRRWSQDVFRAWIIGLANRCKAW
jgi:hypothetical protein